MKYGSINSYILMVSNDEISSEVRRINLEMIFAGQIKIAHTPEQVILAIDEIGDLNAIIIDEIFAKDYGHKISQHLSLKNQKSSLVIISKNDSILNFAFEFNAVNDFNFEYTILQLFIYFSTLVSNVII